MQPCLTPSCGNTYACTHSSARSLCKTRALSPFALQSTHPLGPPVALAPLAPTSGLTSAGALLRCLQGPAIGCYRESVGVGAHARACARACARAHSLLGRRALPHAPVVARGGVAPLAAVGVGRMPVPPAEAHSHAPAHARGVAAMVGLVDDDVAARVDAVALAHGDQLRDGSAQPVTPVEEVVPQDAGHARVREDVRVPLRDLLAGEGPVRLRGTRVVVVQEGHSARRPVAEHPRRLAAAVGQPPVRAVAHSLLQDALGGEVERGRLAARLVHPVDGTLAVAVLVAVQPAAGVRHGVPVLAHREGGAAGLDVLAHELACVALGEVEAPAVVADVVAEPAEPALEVAADDVVGVVNVRRSGEVVARLVVASAREALVGARNRPLTPAHPLLAVVVPLPVPALLRGRAVVDDDVGVRIHALVVQRTEAGAQLALGAVATVQAVKVRRQVALRRDGVRGGRHPHAREARFGDIGSLGLHDAIPGVVVALPVEALKDDLAAELQAIERRLLGAPARHPARDVQELLLNGGDCLLHLHLFLERLERGKLVRLRRLDKRQRRVVKLDGLLARRCHGRGRGRARLERALKGSDLLLERGRALGLCLEPLDELFRLGGHRLGLLGPLRLLHQLEAVEQLAHRIRRGGARKVRRDHVTLGGRARRRGRHRLGRSLGRVHAREELGHLASQRALEALHLRTDRIHVGGRRDVARRAAPHVGDPWRLLGVAQRGLRRRELSAERRRLLVPRDCCRQRLLGKARS
mmetsp:Transcript_13470/g.56426  ORF Transcript_13470/g.56426 Transcript_13470/m.56426 type:complete len:754 (+) Transcript_13470:938-3199(+)